MRGKRVHKKRGQIWEEFLNVRWDVSSLPMSNCIKHTLVTSRISSVSDGSSPWSGESGKTGIIPLDYSILRADKFVNMSLKTHLS